MAFADQPGDPAGIGDLRRRNERLERRIRRLEREKLDLRQELEALRASDAGRSGPSRRVKNLESLRGMAGALAHVVNNLMTCIGCSSALLRPSLADGSDERRHLDVIDEAQGRSAELCERLLLAAGEMSFDAGELDLAEVVKQALPAACAPLGERCRVRTLLGGKGMVLRGDAALIRQLVHELVANAAEAIGDRPGLMSIATGRVPPAVPGRDATRELRSPGPHVFLEVSDDGAGMGPEVAAKAFDPFFSTRFLGRGLGLTVAHAIVERHGGTIRLRSLVGRGTVVQVLLPAVAANPATPA